MPAEEQAVRPGLPRWAKSAGCLVASGLIVAAVGLLFLHSVGVSWSHQYEIRFTAMPEDDDELAGWLRGQPGVVVHTVRTERKGDVLEVTFIHCRNGLGQPHYPDLLAACLRLGYQGGVLLPHKPPE
jgi:hypothetical protein